MLIYPNNLNPNEDLYDVAYKWGWETEELKELVYFCYKTPDLKENARRFFDSEEFKETTRILTHLGKLPTKQCRVLDIGCGNGVGTYALARAGYNAIGIDSSVGEIAGIKAAEKINGLDNANFEVKYSNGEILDFEDGVYDVVWMREVLHHIKDLNSFLKEVYRILRPNGILCCLRDAVIWNENQKKDFFETHPFYPITKDEGCYYLSDYINAFNHAGFKVENILNPLESIINTYPNKLDVRKVFQVSDIAKRNTGSGIFSFFVRK
jgi:SAM-dependent methyltransferase